jgi:meiotically up-regulated gene 157 (Mug157) protein
MAPMVDRYALRRWNLRFHGGLFAAVFLYSCSMQECQEFRRNTPTMNDNRPSPSERCFRSPAIESVLRDVSERIADSELAWLFNNCFPNTLDTTVRSHEDADGRPDTFVITGDIDAMWLRDSTAQVWPYLPYAAQDPALRLLLQGVLNRQVRCVLLDPYANAFNSDTEHVSHWVTDMTEMRPGVHERKYELDSLCAVLRLSLGYWEATRDSTPFDSSWNAAMDLILQTIRVEQVGAEEYPRSPYHFLRPSDQPQNVVGPGHPGRRCGLSRSPFRPSDDPTLLPYLVPANAMAVVGLRGLMRLWAEACPRPDAAQNAQRLADDIDMALENAAVYAHPQHGEIYAYEVDGFGSAYCMDDANVPSLLSLPYLGFCDRSEARYQRTRACVLSGDNPYYSEGRAGSGIGGPHVGIGWIWPMSITLQALTSTSEDEIRHCLKLLKTTHSGTGFMHETFWKDDPTRYTRSWFAWANTLFGELIVMLDRDWPGLLRQPL